MKRKDEVYITTMPMPDNLHQLAKQAGQVVDMLYDASYGTEEMRFPVVLALRELLRGGGPLQKLSRAAAQRLNLSPGKTALAVLSSVGVAARKRELAWVHTQLNGADPTKEWLEGHLESISFMALTAVQEKAGLSCDCAFCTAIYLGCHYSSRENNLEQLFRDLCEVDPAGRSGPKCAATIVEAMAAAFDWEVGE
jgi:hypothetical protein